MFLPGISYLVWFAVQLCKQLHLAVEPAYPDLHRLASSVKAVSCNLW